MPYSPDATSGGSSASNKRGNHDQKPVTCTAARVWAGQLGQVLEGVSHTAGLFADGFGLATIVFGAGEVAEGLDTPLTLSTGGATIAFSNISTGASVLATGLKSLASGNTSDIGRLDWRMLLELSVKVELEGFHVPKVGADEVARLAEQGLAISHAVKEGCN